MRQTACRTLACNAHPRAFPPPRSCLPWHAHAISSPSPRWLSVAPSRPARRLTNGNSAASSHSSPRPSEAEQTAAATTSLDTALLYVTGRHANTYIRAELRSVLDYIEQQHITAAGGGQAAGTRLKNSHAALLLKAAKTCSHPNFAVKLVQHLWPPPRQQPVNGSQNNKRWPRELESCYAVLTNCTPTPWPVASPELLTDYLQFLRLHSYPLLPSMLTLALQLYKHHSAWQPINELFTYCMSHNVPIPRAAYPLFLVAMNHSRNHQQALLLLAHARSNIPTTVALDQWHPIYHAAIDVMGVCGEDEKAMEIVRYMREQGMELNAITYTAAINALCKANKHASPTTSPAYAHLQALHAELKERAITFTQPLYRALIRAYMHFDAQDEAITLITHFMKVHHDPSTAFFMLSVSVEVDNVQAAVLILDNIGARRTATMNDKWRIQLPLYNRVLELIVRQRRWDALRTVWGMRAALQVVANVTSYYFVAQGLDVGSRSWGLLEARVMELLKWRDAGVLDVRSLTGEWTVRAAVWWAMKAAELGWQSGGDWQSGVDVLISADRRGEVLKVLDELGLSSEVGSLEVRVRAEVIERWRRNRRALSAMPRAVVESGIDGVSVVPDELQLVDHNEQTMSSQLREATV